MTREPAHAPGSDAPVPIDAEKTRVRRAVLAALAALPSTVHVTASRRLCGHLLASALYENASTILAFFPVREEPDIRPVIERALADGKTLCLPRTDWAARAMLPCAIATTAVGEPAGLIEARFGLLEPGPAARPVPPGEVDLVLVPGVAFDRSGRRLGRGAGFYDRFLAAARGRRVGVAFDEQLLDRVPTEPHDHPVDCLLTPGGLVACSTGS